jgi:energy-coupling factor transport system ATP-binding protein
MVFQNPDDQLVASLIENDVAFGPENLGVPTAELRERVTNALAQVGLQGFERKETAALSGGQKQRVAIAGVLAMNPQILILDEASAMLDPRGRKGLLRVCKELHAAGMTIVMITHFMEEAALADRVFVLDDGHVALEGTPDSVLTQMELLESLALDIPFGVKVSRALQQRGVPVALHVSEDDLAAELLQMFGTAESPADGSVHAEGGPA